MNFLLTQWLNFDSRPYLFLWMGVWLRWSTDLFVCVPEVTQRSKNSLFLVPQQFINLGFVHVLHIFQVQSQLLCLFSLFSIHLQDGVVPLLQILKCTAALIKASSNTVTFRHNFSNEHSNVLYFLIALTFSWILNLGISFTFSSMSSFWLVSRTSSSAITERLLSRLEISSCNSRRKERG